ncbi:MAG: ATP synthase F0 subunit C [bacterium]|nr:ATP synthase F0 subunit C [bacterium]
MDAETAKFLAIAAIMTGGITGPAIAIGWLASRAMDAIGRNPEAGGKIQTAMILAIAFAEAIAIYALVVALILKFV